MIDPATVCLFVPPNLRKFKLTLFEGIARHILALGGHVIRDEYEAIPRLPDDVIPIIGCTPQFRPAVAEWKARGRNFIAWDRGYLRRVFATWLPNGHDLGVPGGYYRWTLNDFQMRTIRDVPDDRWRSLKLDQWPKAPHPWLKNLPAPWRRNGKHIVVADTGFDYWDLHADRNWTARLVERIRQHTDRPIIVRDKECKVPLYDHLKDAHALATHGSIAAVESAAMGCPVFVDPSSAAAVVGLTDFSKIEAPIYPERERWLHSLAYNQFNEQELVDGTLWRLIQ